MKHTIVSQKAYHETMVAVYDLMNKGENNLTAKELHQLKDMSAAAEAYEDTILQLKPVRRPQTITELLTIKMHESNMNQVKLAATLGLGNSKLSEILTGKRKPDVLFLKALYQKLDIDPAFLLDHV